MPSITKLTTLEQVEDLAEIINQIIETKESFYDSEIAQLSGTVADILEVFTDIRDSLEQS